MTSADESLSLLNEMSSRVKQLAPNSPMCCGGVGASLRPDDCINLPCIDFVIVGEGEQTLEELAVALASGADTSAIPGLVSGTSGAFLRRSLMPDIDDLPFMARDTLARRLRGVPRASRGDFEVRISSGRGCFGRCTFCSNIRISKLCVGEPYRARSVDSLVREMEQVHRDYGVVRFSFWDDNFLPEVKGGLDKARCIHDAFKSLSFRPSFGIQTRADTITSASIDLLKAVGLQNVYLGVENINEDELKLLGKRLSPAQIREALGILYCHGYSYSSEAKLRLRVGYISFTPFTTFESYRENVKFITEYGLPIEKIGKALLAFHETPIRKLIAKHGLLASDFGWRFRNEGVQDLFDTTRSIIAQFSDPFRKVRLMGKIIKFNRMAYDMDELKHIKKRLSDVTTAVINDLAYLPNGKPDYPLLCRFLAEEHAVEIDKVLRTHDLDALFAKFMQDNREQAKLFEKASYVFFD